MKFLEYLKKIFSENSYGNCLKSLIIFSLNVIAHSFFLHIFYIYILYINHFYQVLRFTKSLIKILGILYFKSITVFFYNNDLTIPKLYPWFNSFSITFDITLLTSFFKFFPKTWYIILDIVLWIITI